MATLIPSLRLHFIQQPSCIKTSQQSESSEQYACLVGASCGNWYQYYISHIMLINCTSIITDVSMKIRFDIQAALFNLPTWLDWIQASKRKSNLIFLNGFELPHVDGMKSCLICQETKEEKKLSVSVRLK